jgi:hypothetical protein
VSLKPAAAQTEKLPLSVPAVEGLLTEIFLTESASVSNGSSGRILLKNSFLVV